MLYMSHSSSRSMIFVCWAQVRSVQEEHQKDDKEQRRCEDVEWHGRIHGQRLLRSSETMVKQPEEVDGHHLGRIVQGQFGVVRPRISRRVDGCIPASRRRARVS